MQHDHRRDISAPSQPQHDQTAGQPATPSPRTAAEWRQALRTEELPGELAALPRRQRRRARKAWRSAHREQRTEWVKKERRRVPEYGVGLPLLATAIAVAVAVGAWLSPDDTNDHAQKKKPSATASPAPAAEAPPPDPRPVRPTPSHSPATTPEAAAQGFLTQYCTRRPPQEGSHTASVERAAPYASKPLVDNLRRHGDKDFDRLVAAQALEAKTTKIELTSPSGSQRPAPDTDLRVYRRAKVTVEVKGTDTYTYTRDLTTEIQRADSGEPWMVTRLLGVEE
ncbi:hypothetical protein ACH4PU_31030 [Streptomyces sp. NPDC021100]|uniref:hypothetical protein n=1 Tax=Streptomyces sp. NPDC021100 TaxID=3365114 RepID=UPI00378F3CAE